MLQANNTAHIKQKHWFFQKGHRTFERRVKHLEMHTAPIQRARCNFKGTPHILPGHCNTRHRPKGRPLLSRRVCLLPNTAFVGRYGDAATMSKPSSTSRRNCVLLKGHRSSTYPRQSEHPDTPSSNTRSPADTNTAPPVAQAPMWPQSRKKTIKKRTPTAPRPPF
jgi:hypothetical protein